MKRHRLYVPVLEVHIILLELPDTFYLDESGSGFDRIRIRIQIRIRSVLRGRIRIRNTGVVWPLREGGGDSDGTFDLILL